MTAQIEAVDFFAFDSSYAWLPDQFFARLPPTPVTAPRLVRLNKKLAWHLRLDPGKLAAPEGVEVLAGNRVPKRGEPLAMAYAGHQFGTFVPQLGDGRAILLGEVIDRDGMRRDIQLKGSGPTPFSRRGDGRATLGPNFSPSLSGSLARMPCDFQPVGHWGCPSPVATSGRSHVWSAREAFVLFPSVNKSATAACRVGPGLAPRMGPAFSSGGSFLGTAASTASTTPPLVGAVATERV